MNVLFICTQGRHRSRTAADLFKDEFATRGAGLFSEAPVTAKDLEWADAVCVVEEFQRKELVKRFPHETQRKWLLCLDIPDIYLYGDPELVARLKAKIKAIL